MNVWCCTTKAPSIHWEQDNCHAKAWENHKCRACCGSTATPTPRPRGRHSSGEPCTPGSTLAWPSIPCPLRSMARQTIQRADWVARTCVHCTALVRASAATLQRQYTVLTGYDICLLQSKNVFTRSFSTSITRDDTRAASCQCSRTTSVFRNQLFAFQLF